MNIWDVLETNETDDLSIIKKAYAKKLKSNHPEDNPIGFQDLKEAYDSAIRYAKFVQKHKSSTKEIQDNQNPNENWNDECNISNIVTDAHSVYLSSSNSIELNIPFEWERANNEFIEQMKTLYSNFHERIKIENWSKLLNQDVLWNIENRRNLEPRVFDFLSTHYYLPQNIWKLLDESFNLHNREQQLYYEYNESFVKHVLKLISQPFPMTYNFIHSNEDFEYDLFLELKEKIYDLLVIKDSREAEIILKKAKQIYDQDPDLLRMEGIINFLINKFDYALELINKALSINENDMESYYYRASISFIRKNFASSLEDLYKILPIIQFHQNTIILAIKCNLKLNNLLEANNLITRALNVSPDDINRGTLLELNKTLKLKFWLRLFLKPWTIKETVKQLLSFRQKIEFTVKSFTRFLIKLSKWSMYALIFIICIAFVIATKVGIVVIIYYIVRRFCKKK